MNSAQLGRSEINKMISALDSAGVHRYKGFDCMTAGVEDVTSLPYAKYFDYSEFIRNGYDLMKVDISVPVAFINAFPPKFDLARESNCAVTIGVRTERIVKLITRNAWRCARLHTFCTACDDNIAMNVELGNVVSRLILDNDSGITAYTNGGLVPGEYNAALFMIHYGGVGFMPNNSWREGNLNMSYYDDNIRFFKVASIAGNRELGKPDFVMHIASMDVEMSNVQINVLKANAKSSQKSSKKKADDVDDGPHIEEGVEERSRL